MKKLKKIIKLFILISLSVLFIVLFFCVKHNTSIEYSKLNKWNTFTEDQKRLFITKQIKENIEEDMSVLLLCMDKIAEIDDSGEMLSKNALSLCFLGIKQSKIN